MNDFDDPEDSSASTFRARSNTWPLNRPDLAVSNNVCIDETLPEIDLEEDDLFSSNENWSTALVDHDIMSWDPILNAQNLNSRHHHHHNLHSHPHNQHHHNNHQQQQSVTNVADQQQQQQQLLQPSTVHHHHQQHNQHQHHHQPQAQPGQEQQIHLHNHHESVAQHHEVLVDNATINMGGQIQHQHSQQQIPQHHETLNSTHCLDAEDQNDYHIQQLHLLRLDNNQALVADPQSHYISSLSSICFQGSTANLTGESYISSDHQHNHLQTLRSARYDFDNQTELDLDAQEHARHHQLNHLTSASLDNHSASTQVLSSSLSTSGIGLSGELEDLDYKQVDPSVLLLDSQLEDHTTQQDPANQRTDDTSSILKQASSMSASKTKLNTPRRNAWGNMSYADLISQAINSTNDKRLTLSQIYDWMVQNVPYFKDKGDSNSSAGWKNSVRHNLSLHNRFKRLQNEGTGKSSWWTINPEANFGKCARRRAASMEASKYEKKRGRAKKRAEAVRQGLASYTSLTNSSLNGSSTTLEHLQQPNQSSPNQQIPQSQTDGLSPINSHSRQPNPSLYIAPSPTKTQYERDDNIVPQQRPHPPPDPSAATTATTITPPPAQVEMISQQQAPQETDTKTLPADSNQAYRGQQPAHHQLHKLGTRKTESYHMQQHHHHPSLQQQDQIRHQNHQHQISDPNDHLDMYGSHAIYMSEPCNDCNCTELINCSPNAMSFT